MKLLMLSDDKSHVLDLKICPDSPVYAGVDLKPSPREQPGGFQLVERSADVETRIWENLQALIKRLPTDYVIITGVAPTWVRLKAAVAAAWRISAIYHNDGTNTVFIAGGQPMEQNANREVHLGDLGSFNNRG